MADDKKRITFKEAEAIYPDEWIVFCETREREEDTSFIDGVVYFHSRDQELAFAKAEEIIDSGAVAIFFTGEPKYKNVKFEPLDAVNKPAA